MEILRVSVLSEWIGSHYIRSSFPLQGVLLLKKTRWVILNND